MGLGRGTCPRARPTRRHSLRSGLALAALGLALAALGLVAVAPGGAVGDRPALGDPRSKNVLIVLSSSTAGARSTTSLYAKNDVWKDYLAGERVCAGGERTDLPPPRQAETLICLINYARSARGLRALSVTEVLNAASMRKGQAIRRCGAFAHNPCGGDWRQSVTSTGYPGRFAENLSLASGPFRAPRPTVDAWLNSRPHRENLFRAEWREQGLAMVNLRRFGDRENVTVWVSVLGRRGE